MVFGLAAASLFLFLVTFKQKHAEFTERIKKKNSI